MLFKRCQGAFNTIFKDHLVTGLKCKRLELKEISSQVFKLVSQVTKALGAQGLLGHEHFIKITNRVTYECP